MGRRGSNGPPGGGDSGGSGRDFSVPSSAGSSSSSGCSSGNTSADAPDYTNNHLPLSHHQQQQQLHHNHLHQVQQPPQQVPSQLARAQHHFLQQQQLAAHHHHAQQAAQLHALHQQQQAIQHQLAHQQQHQLPHHEAGHSTGILGGAEQLLPSTAAHFAALAASASSLTPTGVPIHSQAAAAIALQHEMALVSHPTASGNVMFAVSAKEAAKAAAAASAAAARPMQTQQQQASVSHHVSQAILAAQQPYYHAAPAADTQPDRPIGYGAFGVVWSVTDPRTGKRLALKKMPNVFQNLASCKRVFREIKMLASFKHENVLALADIIQPQNPAFFQELYVLTELMQSDLHKIIVSPQTLTVDHVKVFVYQILRGLKYLHSAHILHRDIKPGNLLVNSNCCLKICDFGLARIWEPRERVNMTHEVVTQYYRAPELLMGARKYTSAVDVWSVGCILAELLGRRILFQAAGPIEQLNMIIALLGTPPPEAMKYACDGARNHVLKQPVRRPNTRAELLAISSYVNDQAADLLMKMLAFDPDERLTVTEALAHPYINDGRMRYHSCMCACCSTHPNGNRTFTQNFEPDHEEPFDARWERELARYSMFDLRDRLYTFVMERHAQLAEHNHVPLVINPNSVAYKNFTNSSVAQPSELPPSPNQWDC